jgi:hypothetical protein
LIKETQPRIPKAFNEDLVESLEKFSKTNKGKDRRPLTVDRRQEDKHADG